VLTEVRQLLEKSDSQKSVVNQNDVDAIYRRHYHDENLSDNGQPTGLRKEFCPPSPQPFFRRHCESFDIGVRDWEWSLLDYALSLKLSSKPLLEMALARIELVDGNNVSPGGEIPTNRFEYIFTVGMSFISPDAWNYEQAEPSRSANAAKRYLSMAYNEFAAQRAEKLSEAFKPEHGLRTLMEADLAGTVVIYLMQRYRQPVDGVEGYGHKAIIACGCAQTVKDEGLVIKFIHVSPETEDYSQQLPLSYPHELISTIPLSGRGIGNLIINALQGAAPVVDRSLYNLPSPGVPSIFLYAVKEKEDFWLNRGFKYSDNVPKDQLNKPSKDSKRYGFRLDSWPAGVIAVAGTELESQCRPMEFRNKVFIPSFSQSPANLAVYVKKTFDIKEACYLATYRHLHKVHHLQDYSIDGYPKEDKRGPISEKYNMNFSFATKPGEIPHVASITYPSGRCVSPSLRPSLQKKSKTSKFKAGPRKSHAPLTSAISEGKFVFYFFPFYATIFLTLPDSIPLFPRFLSTTPPQSYLSLYFSPAVRIVQQSSSPPASPPCLPSLFSSCPPSGSSLRRCC